MKWIYVDSTAISALAYDSPRQRLGIEFREKRQVYFYDAVPAPEFEAFLSAESKGRYFALVFLARNYRCTGPFPGRRQAA